MFASIRQGISPVFLLSKYPHHHQARMVRFEMVMTLIVMLACLAVQTFDVTASQAYQPIVAAVPATPVSTPVSRTADPAHTPAGEQAPSTAVAMKQPVVTPACRPATSSIPRAVELGAYGEGLTIIRDGAQYYQVYGDDRATLQNQLRQCGPQQEYAADASYSINWSYALRADESSLCRVVGVKVGARTGMVMPYRATSGNETTSLLGAWQVFATALKTHEDGHTQLAEQYAARLLYQFQTYQAGDCYTMGPAIEAMANGMTGQLKGAQSQYDSATHHGATQGALF